MLSRRTFLTSLAAALAFLRNLRPARAQAAETQLTFLLVNDIYQMAETPFPDRHVRGGFARLAAVVKAERAKGGHVIVAHGGDTLSPSLMSGFDRGAHIIALTNMVGIDAFVPGNHEFDFGKAVFLERMAEAKFPLYGANLRDKGGAPLPGFRDHTMIEREGVRIGLVGLAYDKSARSSSPEDLEFAPIIETTKSQAAAMRAAGADFVVALMHADRGDALALQFARSVDLLLTGHTHDLFINFDGLNALVESGFDAHYVTAVDLRIVIETVDGKRVTHWWPRFRAIDTATVEPDPDVAAAVARYEAEFSREMDVPLARTAVELDSRNATMRTREAAMGNLFADAMRHATRSDIAVINGGGIRAGRLYPPGTMIARRDILAELPFNNRVVVVEMSGAALRRALENGLSKLPIATGRFPQVSGVTIEADASRPAGDRITAIRVGGAPLDPAKTYRVALLDFLARGGDDYAEFRDATRITPDNDAPLLANVVMDYVKAAGEIRTRVDGRIVIR